MALFDRVRKLTKSAPAGLPPGARTTEFTQQELSTLAQQLYSTGVFEPLARNPYLASVPFGPNNPLTPAAINPLGEDGRPEPRRWEYPVAWNVFVTEQRLVPWKVLRTAADQIDVIRRCVEVLKNKLTSMEWDITFSDSASETLAGNSDKNHVRAMQEARDQFGPDITRLKEFWDTPDRINGLGFTDWLSMVLEEILVLDALAIYPHPDLKGDLHSLEILDGSTIKPLLDDRGMRPQSPFPAFQQILYGFPRGEFLATSDDPTQDGSFSADELIYLKRSNRTWTPYGFSPVERCLPVADIYIKRQQWLRAEFTDGVMPDLMFKPDGSFATTPELIRAYENILNDDLAGQTEQRRRARVLPPGLDPIDNTGHSEKFSDTLDDYLITSITGHFGVLPTEIGFSAKGGLGSSGHQDGEANAANSIGVAPLVRWLESQLSDISYKFLGMPRELVFKFDSVRQSDSEVDARRRDIEVKGGQRTINEARVELGLPLLDSPEADVPIFTSGTNIYMVTPEGLVSPAGSEPTVEPTTAPQETIQQRNEKPAEAEVQQEVKAFLKWAKKGATDRDFEFLAVDSIRAGVLNRAAKDNDYELIKSVANDLLPKV